MTKHPPDKAIPDEMLQLRKAPNSDKPGSYQPVIVFDNSVTNPGEILRGEVYFSGYGAIAQPKLHISGPRHVFSEEDSMWKQGFEEVFEGGNRLIKMGGTPQNGYAFGVIHLTAKIEAEGKVIFDMFSDINQNLNTIASEDRCPDAPLSFELRIKSNCRPGIYEISFVFTYFNGSEWMTAAQKTNFTVRNLLQRLDWRVATLALVAAAVSLTADLANAFDNILRILKWSFPPLF
jgi:hypothetical protein